MFFIFQEQESGYSSINVESSCLPAHGDPGDPYFSQQHLGLEGHPVSVYLLQISL